eukprot:g16013.t1
MCRCSLWCLEKCLSFITEYAYVYVAVTGKSFCSSARSSFVFFAKYPLQTALDKMASTALGYLLCITVPAGLVVVGYFCGLKDAWPVCALVIAGLAYVTTRLAAGIYDVCITTLFERVVPYIEFINGLMPGAIVAYEMMNEPDLLQWDATAEAVRNSTMDLAMEMMNLEGVAFGLNDGAHNYGAELMADDLLEYPEYKDRYWLDIHHYFNWPAMCNVYGETSYIDIPCVCSANIPGSEHEYEQGAWAGFMKKGLLDQGYRLYIGEWSAGLQVARNCNNPTKLPNAKQAQVMWRAQKLSFLSQYLHYAGKAKDQSSSFLGDFYWAGRMGHNWNADPSVCCCDEDPNWVDFEWWDWSLLNMMRLGLAQPLSKLGWTSETIAEQKEKTCILADASADGPRALFAAGSDGRVWRAWLPEETPITRGRDDSFVQLVAHAIAEASVCAELLSPVVELELCTLTSRLLVSTFERIAVIGDALAAEVSTVCWVGSKPHKGRLTATFGRFFGADAIIAPRPGGRLWVADGSGTVQQPGLAIA